MKRRNRTRATVEVNYWPGYVDALTNVVLNLLFLIAMFGISLTVLNTQVDPTGKPRRAGPPSGEGAGADGAGTASGTWSEVGVGALAPLAAPGPGPLPGGVAVARPGASGPARPGPEGDSRGPLPGLALRPPGPGGPLGAAPPALPRAPGPAGTIPLRLPRGGDRSGAPLVERRLDLRPDQGRAGGGYAPAGLPGSPLSFSVIDAYQRRFMPGVQITRRPAERGATLLTVSLALGTEPVAALRQPGFAPQLRAGLSGPGGDAPAPGRVRLWTATRLVDPLQRRTAYLALIELRNQLLALGYPADAIETRLIEGSAVTRDARQIYILAMPATGN